MYILPSRSKKSAVQCKSGQHTALSGSTVIAEGTITVH